MHAEHAEHKGTIDDSRRETYHKDTFLCLSLKNELNAIILYWRAQGLGVVMDGSQLHGVVCYVSSQVLTGEGRCLVANEGSRIAGKSGDK